MSDLDLFLAQARDPLPLEVEQRIGMEIVEARDAIRRILLGGPGGLALAQWRRRSQEIRHRPSPLLAKCRQRIARLDAQIEAARADPSGSPIKIERWLAQRAKTAQRLAPVQRAETQAHAQIAALIEAEARARRLLDLQGPPRRTKRRRAPLPMGQISLFAPSSMRQLHALAEGLTPTPHEMRGLASLLRYQASTGDRWGVTSSELQQLAADLDRHQAVIDGHADTLTRCNLRFVAAVAGGYQDHQTFDVLADGAIGLSDAARRYDPRRAKRFTSYARRWVHKRVIEALKNAAPGEVGHDDIENWACMADPTPNALAQLATASDPHRALGAALKCLSADQRQAVTLHFGLDGEPARTIKGVAAAMQANPDTAGEWVTQGLAQLRASVLAA